MSTPLKVIVVDDSLTYRSILKMIVDALPGAEVVGTASNGQIALARVDAHRPDLVLLDVEMPVLDGLETLKQIRAGYPGVEVVMVSGTSRENANVVIQCLGAGAMEFVTKPILSQGAEASKTELRRALVPVLHAVAMKLNLRRSRSPVAAAPPPRKATATAPPSPSRGKPDRNLVVSPTGRPELLLIGASTGGPVALGAVLKQMGPRLSIPVLIVQHMPPLFTASLAAQLTRSTGIPVREAEDGDEVLPGRALLAPGGYHMVLEHAGGKRRVSINDEAKVNGCRPAVDVLFGSVADNFTGRTLSVVLTGMGQDGADGVGKLKRGGRCFCLIQEEGSCVVYGMPRAVNERGLADEVIPLPSIGARIRELCN